MKMKLITPIIWLMEGFIMSFCDKMWRVVWKQTHRLQRGCFTSLGGGFILPQIKFRWFRHSTSKTIPKSWRNYEKNQDSLSQELKQGTELEEQALSGSCYKIIHTKYSINKKDAWRLVSNSDPVEIEQIINYIFKSC